jgi:hypothetical protein
MSTDLVSENVVFTYTYDNSEIMMMWSYCEFLMDALPLQCFFNRSLPLAISFVIFTVLTEILHFLHKAAHDTVADAGVVPIVPSHSRGLFFHS